MHDYIFLHDTPDLISPISKGFHLIALLISITPLEGIFCWTQVSLFVRWLVMKGQMLGLVLQAIGVNSGSQCLH